MWPSRSKEKIRLLSRSRERALEERDEARKGERAAVESAAIASRHLAEAEAAAKRTAARNRQLTEQLEIARAAQGDEEHAALEARLHRALRACVRYRAELAATGSPDGLSMAMHLELAERARREMETKLREVQAVNDHQCRERVTAAGNLDVPKPTAPVREPGEVGRD